MKQNWQKNYIQTDRQTILVYFAWPTKRPGGHQSQLTMGTGCPRSRAPCRFLWKYI